MTKQGNKATGRNASTASRRPRLSAQREAAGKKGRGMSLQLHGRIESKRDPNLQKRIDMVVAMAKAHEVDHSVDVMYDSRHTIRHTTLKVIRVG